ncbi:hypothetical protein BV25DRAFT_1829302 [Artomyces pyxidatus]|uniref:Uncharacterized protein n=1 Tax=Artomyces pyxidatus TaxID=48021 RepID=A0ACB8SSA5_9AGAM|nr:hypothetical protein BV25DRAFT_1829302 [Artomyces pyxidatus]
MQSVSSTLPTQTSTAPTTSSQPSGGDAPGPANGPVAAPSVEAVSAPPAVPVKRGPGRPKGSGVKKLIDPNAPVTPKRPVGRPRKDGLPAGSVPRAAPSGSTRRRRVAAPGGFAASSEDAAGPSQPTTPASAPPYSASVVSFVAPVSYGSHVYSATPAPQAAPLPWTTTTTYSTLSAALQSEPPLPRESPSTSLAKSTRGPHALDPALIHDEWVELLRKDPNALLRSLLQALHAPNPLSRAGPPVEEAFKYHLNALGGPSIPSLYAMLKTFWLPSSPTYFSLTASSSTTTTPPEHRFLYWDPQPLVFNGVACPFCAVPVTNNGCIRSGPIKVYDLGKPFFVIGSEYICVNTSCKGRNSPEGRRFASTDPAIMRSLPPILRDELPITLLPGAAEQTSSWNWQDVGVSKTLWAIVIGSLNAGLGKEATLAIVRSAQEGFPMAPVYKQEEEDEEEEKQEIEQELQHPDDAMHVNEPTSASDNNGNTRTDAWKAQTATGDASGPAQPDGSGSSVSNPAQPIVPISSPYGYPQGTPHLPYPYGPYAAYSYQQPDANGVTLKRGGEVLATEPPSKRIRHCVKCGSKDCKGKGGRSFCTNPCQDCGQMECKGRNSKRPDKTCVDAWP